MTKAKPQKHDVEAWLGDNHNLDAFDVTELQRQADLIAARYPNPDDEHEREVALTAALEVVVDAGDPEAVVAGMGRDLAAARSQERAAWVRLGQAASMLVELPSMENPSPKGVRSQRGFAKAAGVDRMTVLKWLGLRG